MAFTQKAMPRSELPIASPCDFKSCVYAFAAFVVDVICFIRSPKLASDQVSAIFPSALR